MLERSPGCGRRKCWCRNCRRADARIRRQVEGSDRSRSPPGRAGSSRRIMPKSRLQRSGRSRRPRGLGLPMTIPAFWRRRRCCLSARDAEDGLAHIRPLRRHIVENHLAWTRRAGGAWRSTARCEPAGRKGRCWSRSTAPARAWGAGCCGNGCGRRCATSRAHQARQSAIAAMLESPAVLVEIVEQLGRRVRHRAHRRPVCLGRVGPRDLAGLSAVSVGSLPELFDRLLAQLPRAGRLMRRTGGLSREFVRRAEPDIWPRRSRPNPPRICAKAASSPAGFDAGTRPPPRYGQEQPALAGGISETPARRDRHHLPESRLQQSLRLLHRSAPTPTAPKSRRVDAQANHQKFRALYHRGTEEIRGPRPSAAQDKAIELEQRCSSRSARHYCRMSATFRNWRTAWPGWMCWRRLAGLARERRYCRPAINEDRVLEIVDGRHPVLEQQLGSEFVANDVHFGPDDSLRLITGPNMAGKSTYIRQVALIALLAQVGSYVPAKQRHHRLGRPALHPHRRQRRTRTRANPRSWSR